MTVLNPAYITATIKDSGMSLDKDLHDDLAHDKADFLSKKHRIPAPQNFRHAEVREGGFIVVERTRKKRLLRPSAWPLELGDLASAVKAARRMQERHPSREFCIFEQVGSFPPTDKI